VRLRSFGVTFEIVAARDVAGALAPAFPPHATPTAFAPRALRFSVDLAHSDRGRLMTIRRGRRTICRDVPLGVARDTLEHALRRAIAVSSPHHLFLHAGVVGWKGRAILIPGRSFSGKSTLVQALVAAGATYYSDEFAPVGDDGLVHAYRRPLALRMDGGAFAASSTPAPRARGVKPLPVGLIVCTRYRESAVWAPHVLTAAEAAMELLANTIPIRARPRRALRLLKRLALGALAHRSERGEARDAAREILRMI
jgi:hypothetical protein